MSRAFTLIEVLLSLVILVILASSLGWAVREMREKTMVLRRASDDLTVSTAVFDLLDRSITSCVARDPVSGSAGFRGTADSIDIVTRGVLADLEADDGALAGLIRLRIDFDAQSPELRLGRSAASGSATPQTLSRRVEDVRFRYYDGSRWSDSFDSGERGSLPVAVEVSLWFTTALDERAAPPESAGSLATRDSASRFDPSDFEGMGAPMRSDLGESPMRLERAPDRFRIFSVLGGPAAGGGPPPGFSSELPR